MDSKELPQEIVGKIAEAAYKAYGDPLDPGNHRAKYLHSSVKAARIAAEYYEPQLTALKEELERVKGLLKDTFDIQYNVAHPLLRLIADEEGLSAKDYAEREWQAYCKQHNI